MKLFVIGATGRIGGEVVQQALARGHMVTAFVRSPEGIHLKNEGLKIVKGEVTDEEELFGQCKITRRLFLFSVRERSSNRAQFFTTAPLRSRAQCTALE